MCRFELVNRYTVNDLLGYITMKLRSVLVLVLGAIVCWQVASAEEIDYLKMRWDPIHFKPQIDAATNEQCLACHQEILERRALAQTLTGVKAEQTLAWYQTLDTYQGEQDTFHRRHLVGSLATELMDMQCTTCHQGHDPREEAPIPPIAGDAGFTLRKMVNPNTCLMCHGKMNYTVMALPSPWTESAKLFGNNCLTCHAAFRTVRHQVSFLKPEAIEKAGAKSGDSCFGCHGGRSWYRIGYPYPRHAWPGMPEAVPDWAKDRPTESEPRFLTDLKKDQQAAIQAQQ